jgi:hypothetical protein
MLQRTEKLTGDSGLFSEGADAGAVAREYPDDLFARRIRPRGPSAGRPRGI